MAVTPVGLEQAGARAEHGILHPATAAALAGKIWSFAHRKPLGAFGAGVIVVLLVVGIFAPLIAPYDPVKQMVGGQLGAQR